MPGTHLSVQTLLGESEEGCCSYLGTYLPTLWSSTYQLGWGASALVDRSITRYLPLLASFQGFLFQGFRKRKSGFARGKLRAIS